ncbi:RNA polymerase sigma-70 factor [Chitinophaga sancti]|uniref:RNA polymerase sigma-70 factor n=1 Tax=Chitinophaga sancti TaxID=1004 RepID=A0A1K1MPD4_9BACT|nr:RNA polymerase sigma-70 factor [Chitinophaga sancti]WQD62854.1 RNA polymerase sigma-70 factor [Chitinophaga sancti]WQG91522.1 RNA polymerase sigma-70 factor [Chitinophaga sancti]SFW24917.1 RNA polymerase sigma-70 factor, ECF subfamily [Chitinophaga sancti]
MNLHLLTDDLLLRLLQASDEHAFRELYQRYWKKLFTTACYKLKSKEAAEEIVQNIFVSLWEKRATLQIDNLENYLFIAVKYKVINYVESLMVRQAGQKQLAGNTTDESTEATIMINDLHAAIQQALTQLPAKTREVFTMSRFEKCSVREIARHMNLTEKAVEYHITQSLKLLRVSLKDYMVVGVPLIITLLK